jgi:methyltransferase (TIGR00027 family)
MPAGDRPSRTAQGIAAARARESARPEGERLFYDPFARHFLSRRIRFMAAVPPLRNWLRRRNARILPGMFGALVIRTRYMDDHLTACLDKGFRQVVILGAGYDARACRFAVRSPGVRYFEVDRPATQAVKKKTVSRLLGSLPENVTYVPVRFHRERLADKLPAAGYRTDRRTLFLWEGVTMYLEAPAVDATLDFVSGHAPPESSVIFDYFPPSVAEGTCSLTEARTIVRQVRRCGEAIRWGARPEEVSKLLARHGFHRIRDISAEACRRRYFRRAYADLPVSQLLRFVDAEVI